jgi:hypothetical protein
MVHAADIGKASKDFLKKDFFAGNEFKVTQVSNSGKKKQFSLYLFRDAVRVPSRPPPSSLVPPSTPLTRLRLDR